MYRRIKIFHCTAERPKPQHESWSDAHGKWMHHGLQSKNNSHEQRVLFRPFADIFKCPNCGIEMTVIIK